VKDVILTPEGYEQLKRELDHLRTARRREIADRIAAARAFGEIAENAEYDDAKNEQMMLEHRIAQLDERLANAGVIDTKKGETVEVATPRASKLKFKIMEIKAA
jgi:transcription elongation factor GreA